jgi:hypothetical protein
MIAPSVRFWPKADTHQIGGERPVSSESSRSGAML